MRKKVLAVATLFVLAIAAVAYAQQVNTYEVTASTTPATAGSKKKPVPVGIKFGYTVDEQNGNRPAVVKQYSIRFKGLRVNTDVPGKCTLAKLEEGGTKNCPKDSIVGTGFIENATGDTADIKARTIKCNAGLSVVNLGNSKASIYVEGDPSQSDPRKRCEIQLAAPIPAQFKNGATSSLDFQVPTSLMHPLPTLSNAVVKVTSTIKKISKNGKGFFEAVGGCTGGKRSVSVVFTPESGATKTQSTTGKC